VFNPYQSLSGILRASEASQTLTVNAKVVEHSGMVNSYFLAHWQL